MDTNAPAAAPDTPAKALPPPAEAWEPLPTASWDAAAARHLLRRATWSAQPAEVERVLKDGLQGTLDRLFPSNPVVFPKPKLIAALQEDTAEFAERLRRAAPEDKRMLQKEARDRSQQAQADMALKWLQFAAEPAHAATEKWAFFLSDIYVVSFEKVRNAALLYTHGDILRRHSLGPAPTLTKAVSRSPAMVQYLDLQQSKKDAPNENFARELFELFVLGEGNYTEQDIKEAARAFTGHRQRYGEFHFIRAQHDPGAKTVFGRTGRFDGDAIVDLAYAKPAASTFMPREMARFYLSETPLPPGHLTALGTWWRSQNHSLRALTHRFFSSRLFYDSAFRSNTVKSPVQFYLGLVQDLHLDVAPLARRVLGGLRQMGQALYTPPNVRGWVGGRNWINSSTLNARRQLVQALFAPLNETNLNADEQAELAAARAEGHTHFTVEAAQLEPYAALSPEEVAARFIDTFLPLDPGEEFRRAVRQFVAGDAAPGAQPLMRIRNTAATLLQSPGYQLC